MEVHGVGPVTVMFCFMPKAYLENTSGVGRPLFHAILAFIVKRNLYIYVTVKLPFLLCGMTTALAPLKGPGFCNASTGYWSKTKADVE